MSQSPLSLFSVIFLANLRRWSRARRSLARRREPLTAGSDSLPSSVQGKGADREGKSGLMSGDGKRGGAQTSVLAPILDATSLCGAAGGNPKERVPGWNIIAG